MEWVKDIIGMNYFWLIGNCSLSPVLPFSSFCVYFIFVSFSLWLSCFLFVFFSILWILLATFLLIFVVFRLLFLYLFLLFTVKGDALLWHRNPFHSSPTMHLLRRLLSFSIYSPSLFSSCFLFWHWRSSIRTILQFSTLNLSNDFIELGRCFWGFILFI